MDIKLRRPANTTISTTERTTSNFPISIIIPTESSLGTGAIVGISIGVLFASFVILLAIVYACRRYKPTKSAQNLPVRNPTPAVAPPRRQRQNPKPIRVFNPPPSPPVLPALHCTKPLCQTYLTTLNLNKLYFNSSHDKCFCVKCHNPSDKNIICPLWCKPRHGWVCFGLQLNQAHLGQNNVFKEWKTSYYGTSSNLLALILSARFIPFDNDKLLDGTVFRSGHPDTNHCTTSPSLNCASQTKFAPHSTYTTRDGTIYTVQAVLLCKQKPDTYTVTGDLTNFHTVQWKTNTRCTLIPYGLMVRLRKRS